MWKEAKFICGVVEKKLTSSRKYISVVSEREIYANDTLYGLV
jgi:hypothetical protein